LHRDVLQPNEAPQLVRLHLPCGVRKPTKTKHHQSRLNWCPFFRGKPKRRELAERDSFARIAVDILDGRDKEALELSKGIPDLVARAKAENFIALRMLDRALQSADYAGALDAARWVTPEEEKAKAEDRVRASQATALISADKMDKAKEIMANIHSESTRSQLERLIESKLPNPKLNGF
ncbi:MAG: hypothetical protein NT173_13675, partial [Opitutales bacterium]|nr:hypothetical protein [Opitutales bacterium]